MTVKNRGAYSEKSKLEIMEHIEDIILLIKSKDQNTFYK
ncbi:hypothetical protein CDIMF43_110205 [Carnobacterium divergens]|nr:hypothetical protein CDIMF43_110205 [Carnobacterium divergens]